MSISDTELILAQMRADLRVVLLGPGEAQPPENAKRCQIRDRLLAEGYARTVLGEDIIGEPSAIPLSVILENRLAPDDLILVLDAGPAPLVELATIWRNLDLRQNAEVWYPRSVWGARRSTPGDVLVFYDYRLYGDDEFTIRDLTEQFVHSANR